MAHRTFKDSLDRTWNVWSVLPGWTERRGYGPASPPPATERRRRSEFRAAIEPRWASGWLAFETRGEKRRLAPFPEDWVALSDARLEQLCEDAESVRSTRRLIE